jgi:magnesium transporter
MITYDEKQRQIDREQVSIILGQGFVISFQEKEGDVFNTIRERIQKSKGRIRKMKADYLAYSILDAIVDNYFVVLDRLGETIESLEDELRSNPSDQTSRKIHSLKREMIFFRKSIWPLREIINKLERGESTLIEASTYIFLKDLYDHTIQIIDTVETFRDMISGMLDTYLTIISNNMNSTMKVLTVIATIFIPLTFIAGIYGMNFQNMPELGWKWGYPLVLGIMIGIGIFMLFTFKRKKWL